MSDQQGSGGPERQPFDPLRYAPDEPWQTQRTGWAIQGLAGRARRRGPLALWSLRLVLIGCLMVLLAPALIWLVGLVTR